jgi:CheY-like chemotaxis protein
MDIRMPVMDGYEASRLILHQQPSAKVVALTATSRPTDIQEIEKTGMCAFLQKPFSETELISIILKLIPERNNELSTGSTEKINFNLEELERISGGDVAFRNEMLQLFIRSADDALSKFRQYQQSHDWLAIAETAHKLAAPAKHLQAVSLYQQLKKLENMPEHSNPEDVGNLISEIETEVLQIIRTLKQKLENNN